MPQAKKIPSNNSEQTSFRQLIISGNQFSKEYGVIVFEVSKGTQSFYYVVNSITNGSAAFLPLVQRFAMHLKYINGGKHVFFNRLMIALKI